MKLLPHSAHSYDEYWQSIRRYNKWFIQLRWYAILSVLIYWTALKLFFGFEITILQSTSFIVIAGLMAVYNFLFYHYLKHSKSKLSENPLLFSLLQILLDLICLSVLVYFSGGLESPIFMLYIFHMIIGSLILPASLMYSIAVVLIVNLSAYSILEYYGIIPHQTINGFLPFTLFNKSDYIAGVLVIFSVVILVSIMLTNKIAGELYGREKLLKKALDDLNESEKSKQKYVMAVVHELKSPIVASLSQLDLVLGNFLGDVNEKVLDRLKIAKDRSMESIGMINNILHISNYKLFNKLEMKETLIEPIILSVLKNVYLVAEQKKIKIQFIDNENKDKKVSADSILLNLAVSNLINNAVKYTPANGRIHILLNDHGNYRSLEIIDDGIGIPAKEIDRILEDYFRASNVYKIEGTGLGLSLVKQIVENHKGKLEVKSPSRLSKEGRPGSEFKVTLPVM